jgi:hypothetical protein
VAHRGCVVVVPHPRLVSHLRTGHVSRTVYGSIIGLALVLTLQAHPTTIGVAISTLLATAVAVALAELYSELIGARARRSIGEETEPFAVEVGEAIAVAFGIAFPCVFFVAAALGLITLDNAFELAIWTGLGLIAGYGYVAARLSGAGTTGALLQAAGVGLIAVALIVLKVIVH